MKTRTLRQIVSGGVWYNEKTKIWEKDTSPAVNGARNTLRLRRKRERQGVRLARRRLQGLH